MDRIPVSGLAKLSQWTILPRLIINVCIAILLLSGCDGGGGDGGTTGSEYEPVVYTGITTQSTITEENANIIFAVFMGESTTSVLGPSAASSATTTKKEISSPPHSDTIITVGKRLRALADNLPPARGHDSVTLAKVINETTEGSVSGTLTISGDIADDGTGTLTFTYDNFNDGEGDTTDGKLTFRVLDYDLVHDIITDGVMDIVLIRVKSSTSDLSMSGTIATKANIASHTETMIMNIDWRDNNAAQTGRFENFTVTTVYENLLAETEKTISESMSGRVFVDTEGYVDVTTETPMRCDGCTEFIPAQGGPVHISGKNSKARAILTSIHKVRIEVDSNDDGDFEVFHVYFWDNLTGEPTPNEAPVIVSISILPESAFTNDTLHVDVEVMDADGDSLTYSYAWQKNGEPITDQTSDTLPADQYIKGDVINVEVMVSDGTVTVSKTDSVTILNSSPIVDAGADITVTFGDEPSLDGSAFDADNDPLTYTWSIVSQPFDGSAALSDISVLDPIFTYSGQGIYTFELAVSDDESTLTDTMAITVEAMPIFNPYVTVAVPSRTEAAAIGDVNDDGLNDVVVTTSYYFNPENDTHLFVLLQDEFGNLGAPIKYFVGLQPTQYQIKSTAIADMNNDGKDDVVISYENGVGVMLQNALGSLDPITVYASNHMSFSNTYKVVAADFNGDGLNDVASIDWGTQSEDVDVFLQNDNGSLNPPVSYAAPHAGYDDLANGDVNGDGLNDIVVMSGQSYSYDNLSILLQQTDNTFGTAVAYDLGVDKNSNAVGVGDVNGDNLDDVVLAYGGNKPSSKIAIFYQNADGTLDAPISLLSYDSPSAVEIVDINGDGRKDIVIGHSGWHVVGIYFQKPDGTLMGEQRYPFTYSTNNPHRMAVGDIDGDGQKDIVDASGSGITILYHK